jgi:hypothetical protein
VIIITLIGNFITIIVSEEQNMSSDLGAIYLSQQVAKQMIDEVLYGKPEPKRKSRIKAMFKKRAK